MLELGIYRWFSRVLTACASHLLVSFEACATYHANRVYSSVQVTSESLSTRYLMIAKGLRAVISAHEGPMEKLRFKCTPIQAERS